MATEIKTVEDVRNIARETLKGIYGIYKDCDGDPRSRAEQELWVLRYIEYMQKILVKAMKMINCKSLSDITQDILA